MPALLTTIARLPNSSSACWTMRSPPSAVATVSWLATALPPAARISSTTCAAGSVSPARSLTTTRAPRRASSRAWQRPRPRPAPVTIATSPSNLSGAVGVATSDHRESAADAQDLTCDPGAQGRREKQDGVGDVLGFADASQGVGSRELLRASGRLNEARSTGRRGGARRYAVHHHTVGSYFLRDALGQSDQARLGCRVDAHEAFARAA